MDFALVSQRVVVPDGVRPAAVLVKDGRIIEVVAPEELSAEVERRDVGKQVILPGLIDVHVHVNEPGRTEWEGFETATQAAAAGGTTTIVDMPLNSMPVTTTPEAFGQKLAAAEGKLWVDAAFHAGVIPGNRDALDDLLRRGCVAGKAFMIDTGLGDFPAAAEGDLRAGMEVLAKYGRPLLAHAEVSWGAKVPEVAGPWTQYERYLASRPQAWEVAAIKLLIKLCRETGCAVHVVHLSAGEALPLLREAKAAGLPITVETAPHYLSFTAEQIPDRATQFKCAPPIREAQNQALLWEALLNGTIDLVATDHSPCAPELKLLEAGDFKEAWGGISSLQLLLAATLTALRRKRAKGQRIDNAELVLLIKWMSTAPADLLGLEGKGRIAAGCAADLVVFDPDEQFVVTPELLRHKHKVSPYVGETLQGVVKQSYVGGRLAFDHGRMSDEPHGRVTFAS